MRRMTLGVCGWSLVKQERTAMMVLRCKLKSTVEGRRSSLNENTILIEMTKKEVERRGENTLRGRGWAGCLQLQSGSFTWRKDPSFGRLAS